MAIGLIVRVRVAEGKGAEFEAAFAEQAKGVRADEPGNKLYQLVRSREDPRAYVVLELYDDEAALDAHRGAPHMAAGRPRIAPLLSDRTVVEIYDAL
jgi:quinol monooxygenase YgiN